MDRNSFEELVMKLELDSGGMGPPFVEEPKNTSYRAIQDPITPKQEVLELTEEEWEKKKEELFRQK